MRPFPKFLSGGSVILLLCLARAVAAADSAPARDDEVQRQAREVQRLQDELKRAQAELDRLQREQPKPEKTPRPADTAVPAVTPGALGDGAPVEPGEEVEAAALVERFRTDPEGAAQRYAERKFRVRGTVTGFHEPLMQSTYEVRLASSDPELEVVCRFRYANLYRTVATRQKGKELVGRIDDRSSRVLFRKGETVVIEGKCQGRDEDEITFTSCEKVR